MTIATIHPLEVALVYFLGVLFFFGYHRGRWTTDTIMESILESLCWPVLFPMYAAMKSGYELGKRHKENR